MQIPRPPARTLLIALGLGVAAAAVADSASNAIAIDIIWTLLAAFLVFFMQATETYRGVVTEVTLLKKLRIEVAVNDEFVSRTTDAIIRGAQAGSIGDGKIFVLELPECIRIRTGERGTEAIG